MDTQKKGTTPMAKMGRPTDAPAKNQLRIRLTDDDMIKLNECADGYNLSKSDVVRKGIDKMHKQLKK